MRLYYDDAYLREFEAQVVDVVDEGKRVYLDRTAFYPSSGGQPFDTGTLNGVPVIDVVDEGERIAHVLAGAVERGSVQAEIDWARRFDHMQQHTGQHLLSAVLHDVFNIATVSFHLGTDASTIDVAVGSLNADQVEAAERRANEIVFECRPVTVAYQDAASAEGLRKASDRAGTLRVVSIEGLDRSACGGTHVRSTGEIGPILIRKLDKIRGNVRIEFLCGMRAVRRGRSDFDLLARAAQVFSAPLEDVPALAKAMQAKLADSEKARKKLAGELATLRGKALYETTHSDDDGMKRVRRTADAIDDDIRSEAQGFTEGARALMLVTSENPFSILLAASVDSGVHAGNIVSAVAKNLGGRGGGNPRMAQASFPSAQALREAVLALNF